MNLTNHSYFNLDGLPTNIDEHELRIDADSIAKEMSEKVNPRKWICVEAEDVEVENKGNLIILILVEDKDTRETILEGFNNLK